MKKNMGKLDVGIRLLGAVVIIGLYFAKIITGTWAVGLLAVAAILSLTSFVGTCPIYLPFGLSSRRKSSTPA